LVLHGPGKTQPSDLRDMFLDYLPQKSRQGFDSVYLKDRSWTYSNVWLEMSDVFLSKLLTNPNALWLCDMLYRTKQTVCAEFESYLHPHVVFFPEGYQVHRIFALTTYNEDGTPVQTEATTRFRQLLELREKGFETVEISDSPSRDVMEIRRDVWHRTNSEGVVLLVVIGGKIERMIKMKTIWYVVHRGFRENLRRHLSTKSGVTKLSVSTLIPGLQKKLREKLAIFGMRKDESGFWDNYVEELAEYLVEMQKSLGGRGLEEMYLYDYPRIIADVEARTSTEARERSDRISETGSASERESLPQDSKRWKKKKKQ
jgi:hypothetical protein